MWCMCGAESTSVICLICLKFLTTLTPNSSNSGSLPCTFSRIPCAVPSLGRLTSLPFVCTLSRPVAIPSCVCLRCHGSLCCRWFVCVLTFGRWKTPGCLLTPPFRPKHTPDLHSSYKRSRVAGYDADDAREPGEAAPKSLPSCCQWLWSYG